jgi:hypothetical protein
MKRNRLLKKVEKQSPYIIFTRRNASAQVDPQSQQNAEPR